VVLIAKNKPALVAPSLLISLLILQSK